MKILSRHSLWRPRFHVRQMHFHYIMTFTGYIRCFCATTSHDLVSLTFGLLTLTVSHIQCFLCPTHIRIFIVIRLPDTELPVLNIWSHFRYLKQSLRVGRVTWALTEGKYSPHFWIPWPQCHFHGATTKIKPCYRRKITFSHNEGYTVYCACGVSRDLCIGGFPKPDITIFWPRIAYSLYNIYGTMMTIKGSFYWSIPMLKLFSFAKKQSPVKIDPRNGGFSEI